MQMSPEITKAVAAAAVRGAVETVAQMNVTTQVANLEKTKALVERMVTQDPMQGSLRVWSGVLAFASFVLLIPGVDTTINSLIGMYVPAELVGMAGVLLSGAMTWASKYRDKRITR
jgi:hypothetical protein